MLPPRTSLRVEKHPLSFGQKPRSPDTGEVTAGGAGGCGYGCSTTPLNVSGGSSGCSGILVSGANGSGGTGDSSASALTLRGTTPCKKLKAVSRVMTSC